MSLVGPCPQRHQKENYCFDGKRPWVKTGVLSWTELPHLIDDTETLWANDDSSAYGQNDRVVADSAMTFGYSLLLVRPREVTVAVGNEVDKLGRSRRRVRACFEHGSHIYKLVITDPDTEAAFQAKPDGEYRLIEAYLCVSLGERYDGWCYKLVASAITKPAS